MAELTPAELIELQNDTQHNRYQLPPLGLAAGGRFQVAMRPCVFGGIAVVDPVADQPLSTTPEKIVGFDVVRPDFSVTTLYPEGILCNVDNDDLQVLLDGLYMVNLRINATVLTGAAYIFEIRVNGLSSGIATAVDLSNQTTFISAIIFSMLALKDGDIVTVWGESDQGGGATFVMQHSEILLNLLR